MAHFSIMEGTYLQFKGPDVLTCFQKDLDLDSEEWLRGCDYIVNANKLAALLLLPLKYILGTYVQMNAHAQLHRQHPRKLTLLTEA